MEIVPAYALTSSPPGRIRVRRGTIMDLESVPKS